jgi:plastocyanin
MRPVPMLVFTVLLGAVACGGGVGGGSYMTSPAPGPGAGPSGHTTSLIMSGAAFSPATDTVAAGSTVTWTNQDGFNHTVTAVPGSSDAFSSGAVASGASYSHMFSTAGTYAYYCTIHGTPTSGMRGTIVVR